MQMWVGAGIAYHSPVDTGDGRWKRIVDIVAVLDQLSP